MTKPPKFRHVAVHGKNAKTGTKYANDLSKAMNTLVEAGYAVQLQEQKNFTLVFGIHTGQSPEVDEDAPEKPAGAMSPHTRELMARFSRLHTASTTPEDFIAEAKKHAPALVRGFNAEQLISAANELEALVREHTNEHEGACPHARAMQAVFEALRHAAQLQLQ